MQILQENRLENCAVNCVHTVDIFTYKCMPVNILECSDFWGSKISSGRRGGGSDLNPQLSLSGEKVNMSTAHNI